MQKIFQPLFQTELNYNNLEKIQQELYYNFLGNKFPKLLKASDLTNIFKGLTFFYVIFLIYHFNLWQSQRAFLYLSIHGSYGLIWVLKSKIFPDLQFEQKMTPVSIIGGSTLLSMYWYIPYSMASAMYQDQIQDISNARLVFVIFLYVTGLFFMVGSDCQKFYQLKYKKGLISDGFFYYSRNPNYLGECMLYLAFAICAETYISYFILLFVWSTVFNINMKCKEKSLKRKDGYLEYQKHSGYILPKIFGCDKISQFLLIFMIVLFNILKFIA
ncbi:hypothetical protein PPERSA_10472 [Pseudocohnilembus persalinus]|uniref:Uncharacterized protein n=1 Tax=Pseudocohnilembus persalinus TaxID=266149 RepID=A0A0V0R813_PSEPJ|nr:hypothetical protein PPERSA_10472 [Pseudocohnilembus persalinus]|eukprot:KRX10373.1 hypothetical protein PPERSA_10472 [Pseudocohnilembus persalinus]